jgi:hypothetical protein
VRNEDHPELGPSPPLSSLALCPLRPNLRTQWPDWGKSRDAATSAAGAGSTSRHSQKRLRGCEEMLTRFAEDLRYCSINAPTGFRRFTITYRNEHGVRAEADIDAWWCAHPRSVECDREAVLLLRSRRSLSYSTPWPIRVGRRDAVNAGAKRRRHTMISRNSSKARAHVRRAAPRR